MGYQGIIPAISVTEVNPGEIIAHEISVSSDNTTINIQFFDDSPREMYVVTTCNGHTGMTFTTDDSNGISWIGGVFPGYDEDKTHLWGFVKMPTRTIGIYIGEL